VPPLARRALGAVIAGQLIVLLALADRYGYHRDELYFLACGRHLAWGYPDQPPLTPLLARLADTLAPGSLLALRLPAVLVAAGVTLLSGLIARELGGDRFAQLLAALTTGTGTFVLASGHGLFTSTPDLLIGVALVWLTVRALRTRDARLWLVAGVVLGVGLLNKQLPLFLTAGLVAGALLTTPARPALRSAWLGAGAAVAALAWTPVLAWQARHGWPQLELAGQIRAEYGAPDQRILFAAGQLMLFSIGAGYLWGTGLVHLWRGRAGAAFRALAWAYLVVITLFVVTAGQVYYPGAMYPALIAAGAVALSRRPTGHRRTVTAAAIVASSVLTLPAALPVLPAQMLDRSVWSGLAEPQREMVGWPQVVDQVAAAYRTIPADRRASAVVFTANYGEAGAVNRFGPARGLPTAYSGHNGFGEWGPPPAPAAAPVVVVWQDEPPDPTIFRGCGPGRPIRTGVANEESIRGMIYVCSAGVNDGWAAVWPRLVHLSS
jgi:hypothetical protein